MAKIILNTVRQGGHCPPLFDPHGDRDKCGIYDVDFPGRLFSAGNACPTWLKADS